MHSPACLSTALPLRLTRPVTARSRAMPPCPAPPRGDVRCRALLCAGAPGGGAGVGGGGGLATLPLPPRRAAVPSLAHRSAGETQSTRGPKTKPSVQQPRFSRARSGGTPVDWSGGAWGGTAGGAETPRLWVGGWVCEEGDVTEAIGGPRAALTAAAPAARSRPRARRRARGAADFAAGRERAGVRTVTNREARCPWAWCLARA